MVPANKKLRQIPLYGYTSVDFIDFDTIVYDTYDYLDKVISLSLIDPICAALHIYFTKTQDARSQTLINYIRFGTDDDIDIWLMRYGFGFEEIEWLKEHIQHIDSSKITFKNTIEQLSEDKMSVIERYI